MADHMTALVSCFARAYHYRNNSEWIFKDDFAGRLLSEEEYSAISSNMSGGISYFNPGFEGNSEEALRFIVDRQLSPSVLARSVFCEKSLIRAVRLGGSQYIIFASGYDSFSLRYDFPSVKVYELDRPEMISDKQRRILENGLHEKCQVVYISCDLSQDKWPLQLREKGFMVSVTAFGSLLGISYYLAKDDFRKLLKDISALWTCGSSVCFDYPVYEEGPESRKNRELAQGANEPMQAKYSYGEMEKLLEDCGFLMDEDHDEKSMTRQFFSEYNKKNPEHPMEAPRGVHYCLAVKR